MILSRFLGGPNPDVRDRERSEDVKIMVMGSGGVGGYFGAVLHRAGHEVTFVARGEHLEAIRARGLRIESVASGDFTVRPAATDRPDSSVGAELVLYCVKGYDNATAMATMARKPPSPRLCPRSNVRARRRQRSRYRLDHRGAEG